MKRRSSLSFILIAFLLIAGCQKSGIGGKVTLPDGSPAENLTVTLYMSPEMNADKAAAQTLTGKDGVFIIETKLEGDAVLEIAGKDGKGRVHVNAANINKALAITYPVRETVIFLHDNDLHFDFNSLDAFKAKVTEIRAKNDDVFLFNAGDIFVRHPARWEVDGVLQDGPEWYGKRALFMIGIMNDIGYDLMVPGNHELAYIAPFTRAALETAKFPVIAANVEFTTDGLPPMSPYKVFLTGTWRSVAVLGLAGGGYGDVTGVKLLDPSEITAKYLYLADENDIFVALTHIGNNLDKALAEEFPQIDIIIGGHSHTLVETSEIVNTVLVAQAGGSDHVVSKDHVKYLGEVDILLENGVIKDKHGHVTALPLP